MYSFRSICMHTPVWAYVCLFFNTMALCSPNRFFFLGLQRAYISQPLLRLSWKSVIWAPVAKWCIPLPEESPHATCPVFCTGLYCLCGFLCSHGNSETIRRPHDGRILDPWVALWKGTTWENPMLDCYVSKKESANLSGYGDFGVYYNS